jgi:hypothetical protein
MFTSGTLFDGKQAYAWLIDSLKKETQPVSICSAYLKSRVVLNLVNATSSPHVRFLARWALMDLVSGSSDIVAYKILRDNGMSLYVSNLFHGKVYALPSSSILVGSANATSSGFGLIDQGNSEVCTLVTPAEHNLSLVDSLFVCAKLVTDELFEAIDEYVSQISKSPSKDSLVWPDEIANLLSPQVDFSGFLLSDCLMTDGQDLLVKGISDSEEAWSDISLLACSPTHLGVNALAPFFRGLKIFHWIQHALSQNNRELYFGALTALLHEAMMEDPSPYRKTVKSILANLLSWIAILGPSETGIMIDRPNHSQRISLVNGAFR